MEEKVGMASEEEEWEGERWVGGEYYFILSGG